jgi:menaquinone-dependent protoporphyrinogen oxidase
MIKMSVLVVYASKHGATRGIAGRIAASLRTAGCQADVRPVKDAGDLAAYDAFVIGSAAYELHWRKEATEFVRRNTKVLAARPVWLFSSGPLGTEPADAKGRTCAR